MTNEARPAEPTQQLTDAQATLAAEAVDQVMEQAQVFASAWSLVGGRFDSGDGLQAAEDEKTALRIMVLSLARQAARADTGGQ